MCSQAAFLPLAHKPAVGVAEATVVVAALAEATWVDLVEVSIGVGLGPLIGIQKGPL